MVSEPALVAYHAVDEGVDGLPVVGLHQGVESEEGSADVLLVLGAE